MFADFWTFYNDAPWWFFALGVVILGGLIVLLMVLRKNQSE
jgi:hypothetical protein